VHDDIRSVRQDTAHKRRAVIMLNPGKSGASQATTRWVHVNAHNVGETIVTFK
jgi:hypothetical protein